MLAYAKRIVRAPLCAAVTSASRGSGLSSTGLARSGREMHILGIQACHGMYPTFLATWPRMSEYRGSLDSIQVAKTHSRHIWFGRNSKAKPQAVTVVEPQPDHEEPQAMASEGQHDDQSLELKMQNVRAQIKSLQSMENNLSLQLEQLKNSLRTQDQVESKPIMTYEEAQKFAQSCGCTSSLAYQDKLEDFAFDSKGSGSPSIYDEAGILRTTSDAFVDVGIALVPLSPELTFKGHG